MKRLLKNSVAILTLVSLPAAFPANWLLAAPADPETSQGNGVHLCNAQRTGYTASHLPTPFQLAWVYMDRHKPRAAWREPVWEPQRIDFDYAYAVSAGSGSVYVASTADHAVHALDLASGQLRWKFFTDGPVRLAPSIDADRIYFGSDDGFVYCLKGRTGELVWRFRPDIPDERLIGNEQMISRWPVRSGVLVEDGKAYATFGMLAPEGVCVCCLDAGSGTLQWINDACGTRYMARPHVPGMGGVSPQGYLAAGADTLIVPCGRAPPALFNKHSGRVIYHEAEGDFTGGAWTMAAADLVFTPCETLAKEYGAQLRRKGDTDEAAPFVSASLVALDRVTGREVFTLQGGRRAVLSDTGILTLFGGERLTALRLDDVRSAARRESTIRHTTGHFVMAEEHPLWSVETDVVHTMLQAGKTLIGGGRNQIVCFNADTGAQMWHAEVDGQARDMTVAERSLVVSTTEGKIYCFQPAEDLAARSSRQVAQPVSVGNITPHVERLAGDILTEGGVNAGYGLVVGTADGSLLQELARQSDLTWYHVTTAGNVGRLRSSLDQAALQGMRITVHACATNPLPYADYFANLVVVNVTSSELLTLLPATEAYRVLRPCGGVAVVRCTSDLRGEVQAWLVAAGVPRTECRETERGFLITRGSLDGAGQWTHQYADAGKSCSSEERRARLPLKALWFGGLGPGKIVSRHFRTPAPLVVEGRCFVPGTDDLIAMDIYNGRILWERALPGFAHWPAAYRGPSLAVDQQAVYALQETRCLVLDPATGATLKTFHAPLDALESRDLQTDTIWEYLAVTEQLVIGTLGQAHIKREWWSKAYPENRLVFACDKNTGHVIWTHQAGQAIDSNALAISEGRIFLIEGGPREDLRRRGIGRDGIARPPVLKALELASGREIWRTTEIVPTQNSLWVKDDVLVATINPYSRSMEDPQVAQAGGGVAGYSTHDGKQLWKLPEVPTCSPVLLEGVLHLPQAYDLVTGQPIKILNPISHRSEPFSPGFPRTCANFCGTPNLLMSRSGSLGFYDLATRSGYFHYPIVRASCWINMIPAGGLVVVPEGSSSCVCGYNYKTSLALVAADREHHFGVSQTRFAGPVAELHINFGAPGDRTDESGHTWFAYPRPVAYGRPLAKARYGPRIAGGKLPVKDLSTQGACRTFVRYADWADVNDPGMAWLSACGLTGPVHLKIRVSAEATMVSDYAVRLYFCELEALDTPRRFDVRLQDETCFAGFDVTQHGNRSGRLVSVERVVAARDTITLELVSVDGEGAPPILNGVSVVKRE